MMKPKPPIPRATENVVVGIRRIVEEGYIPAPPMSLRSSVPLEMLNVNAPRSESSMYSVVLWGGGSAPIPISLQ